jgi:hypothetical protein
VTQKANKEEKRRKGINTTLFLFPLQPFHLL